MANELARSLAEYAGTLSFEEIDDETVERTKTRILDVIACGSQAYRKEPVQNLLEYASHKKSEDATILCTSETASVETAALVSGGLIRYLDWNDTYFSIEPGHPSDNLGAILPVADAYDCSGKEVIRATVLAYELHCRLCDAASLRDNGFDHVNYGLVSSTLAVGSLIDLSVSELTNALNIALTGHIALRQARTGELTEWKGFAFANTARNAIVAAELADHGVHGPSPIFEGKFGFFNQVTGEFPLNPSKFGGNKGNFKLNQTHIKKYPVEFMAQTPVDCVLDILEKYEIEWTEITRIENQTYRAALDIIVGDEEKWDPQTRGTADHSMPYCIARALIDGEMDISQFSEEKIKSKDVRKLMEKMEIIQEEEFTDRFGTEFPNKLIIETNEQRLEQELDYPSGHYKNPLTREGVQEKFEVGSGEGRLTTQEITRLDSVISNLENESTVSTLFKAAKPVEDR